MIEAILHFYLLTYLLVTTLQMSKSAPSDQSRINLLDQKDVRNRNLPTPCFWIVMDPFISITVHSRCVLFSSIVINFNITKVASSVFIKCKFASFYYFYMYIEIMEVELTVTP